MRALALLVGVVLFLSSAPAALAAQDELEGSYTATGTMPAPGGSSYSGTVTVVRKGDVYEVTWDVGAKYVGTGVRVGDVLSVGYTDEKRSWFGIVAYRIEKGGVLTGTWCSLLETSAGREKLVRR